MGKATTTAPTTMLHRLLCGLLAVAPVVAQAPYAIGARDVAWANTTGAGMNNCSITRFNFIGVASQIVSRHSLQQQSNCIFISYIFWNRDKSFSWNS